MWSRWGCTCHHLYKAVLEILQLAQGRPKHAGLKCFAVVQTKDEIIQSNAPPPSHNEIKCEWVTEPITKEMWKLLTSSLRKHSSPDPLPTWLLKKVSEDVSGLPAAIYNKLLPERLVPECFKLAVVTPLLKKEELDTDYLSNFRKISNISSISKRLKWMVNEWLKGSLYVINKLLSAYQLSLDRENSHQGRLR